MSRSAAWKGTERAIAKMLQGKRTGQYGGPDVMVGDWLRVEAKHRKALPGWIKDAMAQSARNAGETQLPIVVLHEHGGRHSDDMVMIRLGDFKKLFGDLFVV